MPTITIPGTGAFNAPEGQRLVLAIKECGVDIGHRCGGYARCTTCRIHVTEGEPAVMTSAEHEKLEDRKLLGEVRLACQIVLENDITVEPLMRVSDMGWADPGPMPEETVTPEPEWLDRSG